MRNPGITRRELIGAAAAACGAVALGSIRADADEKPKPTKRANERRPLLFGAGMIWASWLNRDKDYDLKQMDALKSIGGKLTSATFDWCNREKENGKWDWPYPDHALEAATKRGMKQFDVDCRGLAWAQTFGFAIGPR